MEGNVNHTSVCVEVLSRNVDWDWIKIIETLAEDGGGCDEEDNDDEEDVAEDHCGADLGQRRCDKKNEIK